MVDDTARERAIDQALKAVGEVAAAQQAQLIEEHNADPERPAAQSTFTNSPKLLRQARERLGHGLRAAQAGAIAEPAAQPMTRQPCHLTCRSAALRCVQPLFARLISGGAGVAPAGASADDPDVFHLGSLLALAMSNSTCRRSSRPR
jgi:hypothetical protein